MKQTKREQTIGTAIDYLRMSILGAPDYVQWACEGLALGVLSEEMIAAGWQQYKGHEWYEGGERFGFVGQDLSVGGTVEFSGSHAHTRSHVIKQNIDGRIEYRIARLDVCNTVEMAHGELKRLAIESEERGETKITQLIDKGEGVSVYYGLRENEKFCRIYEKVINGVEYVRLEFELKGRKAHSYTGAFFQFSVEEFAQRVYAKEFEMLLNKNSSFKIPASLFVTFRAFSKGRIIREPRKEPNIEAWLYNQIKPILMRNEHLINLFVREIYFDKVAGNHDFPHIVLAPLDSMKDID